MILYHQSLWVCTYMDAKWKFKPTLCGYTLNVTRALLMEEILGLC